MLRAPRVCASSGGGGGAPTRRIRSQVDISNRPRLLPDIQLSDVALPPGLPPPPGAPRGAARPERIAEEGPEDEDGGAEGGGGGGGGGGGVGAGRQEAAAAAAELAEERRRREEAEAARGELASPRRVERPRWRSSVRICIWTLNCRGQQRRPRPRGAAALHRC